MTPLLKINTMNTNRYIGIFDTEELFDKAVQKLTDSKVLIEDIYAPVPVHHAVKNVAGSSRLPTLAYFLGLGAIISQRPFDAGAPVQDPQRHSGPARDEWCQETEASHAGG